MISKNFLFSVIFRSSTIVSAFGIFLLSSYLYGPEGRGIFTLVSSFYLTISFVFSLGLGRTAYQLIGLNPNSGKCIIRALAVYIVAFRFLAFLVILLCYLYPINRYFDQQKAYAKEIVMAFGLLPFYLWQNMSNFLFAGQWKTSTHDKLTLIARFFLVGLLGFVSYFGADLNVFLLVYGSTSFLIFCFEFYVLNENSFCFSGARFYHLRKLMSGTLWSSIDSLAQAAPPFALFLLGLKVSSEHFGNLSFALQIVAALYFPFTVLQIKIQEMINAKPLHEAAPVLKRAARAVMPASIALWLTVPIISFLLPKVGLHAFASSKSYLYMLLLTIPLAGFTSILQATLTGLHKPKLSSYANIMAGTANIMITLILAPYFNEVAAIFGIYASYVVTFAVQAWLISREKIGLSA